jgi:hypothetical protein
MYIGGRPSSIDVRSDRVFQKAREWIHECEDEHEGCPQATIPLLPSRVIDVGDENCAPRLYLSKSGDRARCVALSYCWGEGQAYATTTSTLQEKTAAIPMAELGQTIQDAIVTTRKVGVPYIWIDALCIIQDDDDDKREEIGVMDDIYKRATVTIAAASAERVLEGFLHLRPKPDAMRFPFYASESTQGVVSLLRHEWVGNAGISGDALDFRGWCFQETLLPCRRLIYGKRELFWSCGRENYKPIVEGNIHFSSSFRMLPPSVWGLPIPYSIRSEQDQAVQRNNYVNEFSKRRLTDPRDRTKAIAGIAQVLQDLNKDEYLMEFGAFRNTIRHQLAWHLDTWTLRNWDKRTDDIVRKSGVPTWSWASINGPTDRVYMAEADVEVVDDGSAKALNELREGILKSSCKNYPDGYC